MAIDLLVELDSQIAAKEEELTRLRNARAALVNHRTASGDLPTVEGPNVETLPLTQAIRQVLQWNLDRGKKVMTVKEVFESLRPYTVMTAKGRSLWESELPWKAFVIACTAPVNQDRYWTVTKSIVGERAKLLANDTIQLKPLKQTP